MDVGRRPLARGSACVGMDHHLHTCPWWCGAEAFGQAGGPRSRSASAMGGVWNERPATLVLVLLFCVIPGQLTAPPWDSVSTSGKKKKMNPMSSEVSVSQSQEWALERGT